jgi:hypothetical protein
LCRTKKARLRGDRPATSTLVDEDATTDDDAMELAGE